ncbi:hypothetical protein Q3G72_029635 [Acer saccharum]|nr:hypothetical protein Q3G72_029635 [Acer saccharum]
MRFSSQVGISIDLLLRREAEKTFSSAASLPSQKIGELDPQKRVDLIEATLARSDATATGIFFGEPGASKIVDSIEAVKCNTSNSSNDHPELQKAEHFAATASGGGGVLGQRIQWTNEYVLWR